VPNGEYTSVNKKIISDDVDFDDNPDLAPTTQAYSNLFVEVFAVKVFHVLQKAVLNIKNTLHIRGPPIF
jgi:hypothetical protein